MNVARGLTLKLAAIFLFVIMASLIKAASEHVPPGQAVFFRSFFALPIILGWLALRHDLRTGLKTENLLGHFWRGLVGVTAMGCGFAALGILPLPEVTAIGFAAPLMTVIFAVVLLGEKVRLFRISAVFLGLIGVSVIMWPLLTFDAGDAAMFGVVLVLLSAAFRALAQIHIRKLVKTEETSAIVFYFSITATLFSLATLPFGWVVPTAGEAAMLIAAGLIGGVAQILLTSAYRWAEASMLAPFDYASILFATAIGYFVFNEVPTGPMLIGSSIVIAAGVLIIWRERQLGLKRGKARPGLTPQG